jgi:hypothetical protein
MKVTIISNGNNKIVLKPESQAEILAIKDMHGKEIKTEYHESTQILGESFPDCLVLATQKEEARVEPTTQVVLISVTNGRPIAVIPHQEATYSRMVDAIVKACNYDGAERVDSEGRENILVVDVSAGDKGTIEEYEILQVPIL